MEPNSNIEDGGASHDKDTETANPVDHTGAVQTAANNSEAMFDAFTASYAELEAVSAQMRGRNNPPSMRQRARAAQDAFYENTYALVQSFGQWNFVLQDTSIRAALTLRHWTRITLGAALLINSATLFWMVSL
jgi:hypothetical protein